MRELRQALRRLIAYPTSTAAALVSLSVAIGFTAAVFGFVNAVLLRPFPYASADRLVVMWGSRAFDVRPGLDGNAFDRWRAAARTIDTAAAFQLAPARFALGTGDVDDVDTVVGAMVGRSTFSVLRAVPLLGQPFSDADPDDDRSVMLSHALWQTRFGSDRHVVGRSIALNGMAYAVRGVMQPDFFFPDVDAMLWIPLPRTGAGQVQGIARLKAGATIDGLLNEAESLFEPTREGGRGQVGAFPLHRLVIRDYDTASWTLFAAGILLVLTACANVGNILVARRLSRSKEVAVRISLGANRRAMVMLLLAEPLLLSAGAAGLGLALAYGAIAALKQLALHDIPRIQSVALDGPVLVVALCLSLVTALLAGLAPVVTFLRSPPAAALREGDYSTASPRSSQTSFLLLTLQVAVTSLLLVGASLLIASFTLRSRSDWGFRPDQLMLAEVTLPAPIASVGSARTAFVDRVVGGLAALPGATGAAATTGVPVKWNQWEIWRLSVDGRLQTDLTASAWRVTPGYFRTMGVPLLRGREFQLGSEDMVERRAVISTALARRLWPGESPIGRSVTVVRPTAAAAAKARELRERGASVAGFASLFSASSWEPDGPPWMVIGEVGNVRMFGLDSSAPLAIYVHQNRESATPLRRINFVLRSTDEPANVSPRLRAQILGADGSVKIDGISSMAEIVSRSVGGRGSSKLLFVVSTVVALISVLVASLGVYGVAAFTAERRVREIAIRRALGARPIEIIRPVFRQAGRALLLGLALGLVGASAVTGALRQFLFGVTPFDLRAFTVVAAIMVVSAGAAAAIPLRRALIVNPADILRRD